MITDQLVFVDDTRPDNSFAIARNEISDYRTERNIVTITTRRPLGTWAGNQTSLQFTIWNDTLEPLTLWAGARQVTPIASASGQRAEWVYYAKHPHKLGLVPSGSCAGNLIVAKDRLTYDSLEEREHTRQWLFKDIRSTKRRSPYRLEIETRAGEKYALELEGKGMDISVYRQLQNWIALARRRR